MLSRCPFARICAEFSTAVAAAALQLTWRTPHISQTPSRNDSAKPMPASVCRPGPVAAAARKLEPISPAATTSAITSRFSPTSRLRRTRSSSSRARRTSTWPSAERLEHVMDLLRRDAQHARQVTHLVLRVARQPSRREALHHELTRVRLRHLEHVEVGVELGAHGAERRDRLVQEHVARRQVEVHLVDELEPLADDLDLVDLGQRDAVVARVELVQVADELGLARLLVADAEIGEPLRAGPRRSRRRRR